MPATLIAITLRGLGRKYTLNERCVLGRHPECDIQVVDGQVSKRHAQIVWRELAYWLEDLQSLNGVFVNGERIAVSHRLVPNDTFTIGSFAFVFEPALDVLPDADDDRVVVLLNDDNTQIRRQETDAFALPSVADEAANVLWESALRALVEQTTAEAAVGRVMKVVAERIPHQAAAVLAGAADSNGMRLEAVCSGGSTKGVAVSKTIATHVIAADEALRIHDIAFSGIPQITVRDKETTGAALHNADSVRAVLAAPLRLCGQSVGLVWLSHSQPGHFTDQHVAALRIVAPVIAAALLQRRQHNPVERERMLCVARHDTVELVGASQAIAELKALVARAAPAPSSVLINGETGVGKEVVARLLHERGRGKEQPFVAINCGALPESLAESELFGYERGAFTGAQKRTLGKLELAAGGTLFLDEIGELSLALQVKLLRALEQRQFYRLGGIKPVAVDLRLVAATHRDLEAMCRDGSFRQDLLYRIKVIHLTVPPLRERPDDIEPLTQLFLRGLSRELNRPNVQLSADATTQLKQYRWPGNVRELRNVIERALVLCDGPRLECQHLALWATASDIPAGTHNAVAVDAPLVDQVAALERTAITAALRRARGTKAIAASALGISRPTLDKKIRQYAIDIFEEETR